MFLASDLESVLSYFGVPSVEPCPRVCCQFLFSVLN